MKSSTKKVESNIYVETRGQATRFIVAVYPIPKDSATFPSHAEGLLWARRRRVELLEEKAGIRDARSPQPAIFQPSSPFNPLGAQAAFDPRAISMSAVLEYFREHELGKLGGKGPEASLLAPTEN